MRDQHEKAVLIVFVGEDYLVTQQIILFVKNA